MSARLILLASCLLLAPLRADEPADDELAPFFKVPGSVSLTGQWRTYSLSELPRSLVRAMQDYTDWGSSDGPPTELKALAYDLNHDGQVEYFFLVDALSGRGGDYHIVYGKFGSVWKLIAEDVGNRICALPAKRGWMPLVSFFSGGGGSYAKAYHEFQNGRYEMTGVDHLEHGIVTHEKRVSQRN
jgi:hypothetical protein